MRGFLRMIKEDKYGEVIRMVTRQYHTLQVTTYGRFRLFNSPKDTFSGNLNYEFSGILFVV